MSKRFIIATITVLLAGLGLAALLVDRIQIAGGYVWAQFDWHLYRASLSALQ
jgi:hypothetical protein